MTQVSKTNTHLFNYNPPVQAYSKVINNHTLIWYTDQTICNFEERGINRWFYFNAQRMGMTDRPNAKNIKRVSKEKFESYKLF